MYRTVPGSKEEVRLVGLREGDYAGVGSLVHNSEKELISLVGRNKSLCKCHCCKRRQDSLHEQGKLSKTRQGQARSVARHD